MNDNIIFFERQKFTQWWIWLILVGIDIFLIFALYQQVLMGHPVGDKPMSNEGLIFASVIALLFSLFFGSLKLETQVRADGLYVRFFPLHLTFRRYAWESISKAFIRRYSPAWEYGGWGIRLGLFGKGTAFNVSGNMGLQLVFENNRKLLIGTNKPGDLERALVSIGQLKP